MTKEEQEEKDTQGDAQGEWQEEDEGGATESQYDNLGFQTGTVRERRSWVSDFRLIRALQPSIFEELVRSAFQLVEDYQGKIVALEYRVAGREHCGALFMRLPATKYHEFLVEFARHQGAIRSERADRRAH